MHAKQLVESIDALHEANITVMILGASGIGKTEISRQIVAARKKKYGSYGHFEFNAALANLADTLGYNMPQKKVYKLADGSDYEMLQSEFTYPYYFLDQQTALPASAFERCLFVVEEYGQATGDVKRALATATLDKRVGNHKLPPLCDILILSNRPEDRSGNSKDFDFLINRRAQLHYQPDVEGWIEWADDNGVNHRVKSFARNHDQVVFHGEPPEEQRPWCTPRSLVASGRFLDVCEKRGWGPEHPLVAPTLEGIIGPGETAQMISHLRLEHTLPEYSEVIQNPTKAKVPDDMATDALMIIAYKLAAHVKHEHVQNVVTYMQRLPAAFGVAFIKSMLKRDDEFWSHKAVGDWSRENADILAAMKPSK